MTEYIRPDRGSPVRQKRSRPGVIIESQSGGSGGNTTAELLIPSGNGHHVLQLGTGPAFLQGELSDSPMDLSGDGRIGLVVDESGDPALRGVFATDMARLRPICFSEKPDRNGACAASVADAARAGQFETAWAAMLSHYERGGSPWESCDDSMSARTEHRCAVGHVTYFRNFPESLRAFLTRTGYLRASP